MSFNQVAEGVYIISPQSTTEVEKLPVGTYNISIHPNLGYIVERTTDFKLPEKIYGDNPHLVKTMKSRFLEERAGKVTTAVLSGLKGSGKTLAAKQFANECREEKGISTFLVSSPYSGQSFNTFLTELQQAQGEPIILLVDEFEKIYTEQPAINALLTLLDGTATLHMAVLLTMNTSLEERKFEFFKNRPGRAYFNKHFENCPEKVIREYCQDNLQYLHKLDEIVNFSYRFSAFTLDLLTTLVKEVNLTEAKVSLDEICTYINIKPDVSASDGTYLVRLFNSKTRQPLSMKGLEDVVLDYDFVTSILAYGETDVEMYVREEDALFPRIFDLYKQQPEYQPFAECTGLVLELSKHQILEVVVSRVRLPDLNENGNAQYTREFSHFKIRTTCAIQHPDEPEERDVGSLGVVNYAQRKITFEIPLLDLTLIVESRNRRVNESLRLVL